MVHTHARHGLDTQMRRILAQLELISAIPAVNYNATHGTDEHPGGRKPPGDIGYREFAAWYGPPFHERTPEHPGCVTDEQREDCITVAKETLEHLRKTTSIDASTLETHDQLRERMLVETEGWSPQSVSQSAWRMSVTIVRRLRVAAGRDAETGFVVVEQETPGLDLVSRAREMKGRGMSIRGIAMALGCQPTQVVRYLKKVA